MYQVIKLIPETPNNPVGEKYVIKDGKFYHRHLVSLVDSEEQASSLVDSLKLAGQDVYYVKE